MTGCSETGNINQCFDRTADRGLVHAAFQGNAGKMDQLLKDGSTSIDCRGKDDTTPLLFSVLACNKRAILLLLQNGANPNLQDVNGYTPTNLTAGLSDPWFLETMLKNRGNPNFANVRGETPIFEAVMSLSIQNIDILAKAGTNLNAQTTGGATPMITAANLNRFDIVYHLLELGADPTIRDINGYTVLSRIQHNLIDPASPLAKDREKVIDWLKARNLWKIEEMKKLRTLSGLPGR